MLKKIWYGSKILANWLLAKYMKQNFKQREMWAKMFHVLAAGAAVGVGMKYLSDTVAENNINVIFWAFCAIIFHVFSLISLMGGDDKDDRN